MDKEKNIRIANGLLAFDYSSMDCITIKCPIKCHENGDDCIFYEASRAITDMISDIEEKDKEIERLKAIVKIAEKDLNGICYLCSNAIPYRIGESQLYSCDHFKGKLTNKRPRCQYFKLKNGISEG